MSRTAYKAFSGLEELRAILQAIPKDLKAEILEPACGKAARPIQRASIAFAPEKTGALKKSIGVKTVSNKMKGTAAAIIGPVRGMFGKKGSGAPEPANYAHLLEFGHVVAVRSEHSRRKYTKKESAKLAKQGDGAYIGKDRGAHKFVQPYPFMGPGFAAGAPAAELVMAREINKGIDKTRARLVKAGQHRTS